MTLNYDFKLDLDVVNNSHTQLIRRIPRGARVLELGCATGYMSEYLRDELGCTVVGVEYDADAAAQAEARCDRVIVADLESPDWRQALDGERFDVVTCADVIEHLRDPHALLEALPEYMEPEGRMLASIPNSAHASIRLQLLEGRLTYQDTGILDRTHLHFYTQDSVRSLFSAAGYRVDELSYTFQDLADSVIRERLERMGLEPSERTFSLLHAPDAAAFQFIVNARPPASDQPLGVIPEISDDPLTDSLEVHRNLLGQLHESQQVAITRGTMIEERDQALAQQHQALTERARLLEQQRELVAARERELERRQALLGDRNNQLAEQQKTLEALRQQLQASRAKADGLERALEKINREHARVRADLAAHSRSLQQVLNSTGWRLWRKLTIPVRAWRRLKPYLAFALRNPGRAWDMGRTAWFVWRSGGTAALRRRLSAADRHAAHAGSPDYQAWIRRYERYSAEQIGDMRTWVEALKQPPRISIVMPVYNAPERWLREALDSVLAQLYPYWELCIADDRSSQGRVREVLEEYRQRDRRIKLCLRERNGHISAASNSALELASGEFLAFMDQDDLLSEYALYYVAQAIQENPEAGLIYSDEDKIDAKGERYAHYFKPDFNPDLMLSHNMICHLGVYRRALVQELGGFREGFEGAQDYDLALRVIARLKPEQIQHIPHILYHWRAIPQSTASGAEAKPYAMEAAIKAVAEYLEARGVAGAEVSQSPRIEGMLRVRYPLPEPPPLVSMIMPTRNGLELIQRCIESVREHTRYPNYEILVVDNNSDDPATIEYLETEAAAGRIRLVKYPHPFNFSAINNYAVQYAKGQVLAFMNNDLEVTDGGWLDEMLSQAVRPEIGAVGACLWYPDDRLQHGGVVLGLGGVAGHAMKMMPRGAKGYNARAVLVQNYSAVTAACLLVRRRVFDEVEGFDEKNLPVAFNDVDFCLRIRERGYRNLWTPYAELYHHESASRGPEDTPEKQRRFKKEIDYMRRTWGPALQHDPAYNPNLTDRSENFALR